MDFIHSPYLPGETIAAVATPPGEGGVSIIRISGKNALDIAEKIFSGPVRTFKSHTAHYGRIINDLGEHVDDVLLLPMLGKRSYTGEDTVEIHCHGGSLITRRVLETVIKAGARAARPGEFTFKAFINGKIDLAQAEAVQALISAKSDQAVHSAEAQLQGSLSNKILEFKHALTNIAAILEAWVDFPEEGLEFSSIEEICEKIEGIAEKMQHLLNTYHDGKLIHEGVSLCLAGSPNVGKSSLMNALLDKERAIVSHIPGTTRDILEDHLKINGLPIRLIDTAGIRNSKEIIEQEGIRRTREAMQQADIILFVLDASREINEEEYRLLADLPAQKTVVIWNKIDIALERLPTLQFGHMASISAKKKEGLETLKQKIDSIIWQNGPPAKDEVLITNLRHKESLFNTLESANKVIRGLKEGISPEFIAFDMRQSLHELGKIIGTNITEDILSSIFSKFCIGK